MFSHCAGREARVKITPRQSAPRSVGRNFPGSPGGGRFVSDNIFFGAANGTAGTENGFYNWCNGRPEDFRAHDAIDCTSPTEIHWDPEQTR